MSSNREKLVASAQKYVEKGQYEKAIKDYLKAVADDDKDVRIWLKIGDLYAKINNREGAVDVYQKVARFYSDQGFYLKAVAVFKQILKLDPKQIQINIKLAELYKQLGLLTDAMVQYEAVAAQLNRDGKSKEALAAIKQIVELDPDNVDNRARLAELYTRENMNREAIDEFARAADQLHEKKRWDEYLRVAERLLFFSGDNRPVSKEVARLLIERGEARRALPRLQVCFKADPRDVETLWLLARAFESLEQIPKAVTVLRELARIYVEGNDGRNRDEAYRKLLQLSPGDPEAEGALSGRSRVFQNPTEPKSAIKTPMPLRESRGNTPVPEEPTYVHPANKSVNVKTPAPVPDEAPSDEAITKILGETDVYIKYKLFPKAIEHVQKIFERDPNHVLGREKLKALYLSMGRNEDALGELWKLVDNAEPGRSRRYLREILELSPQDARAMRALQQMPATTPAPQKSARHDDDVDLDADDADDVIHASDDDVEELSDDEFVESSSYEDEAYPVETSEPTNELHADDPTGVVDPNRLGEPTDNVDDELIPLVVETPPAESTATAQVAIIEDRFALPEDSSTDLGKNLPTTPRAPVGAVKPAAKASAAADDHELHTRFENPLDRFLHSTDPLGDVGDSDLPPTPLVVGQSSSAGVDPTRQTAFPSADLDALDNLLPRDSVPSQQTVPPAAIDDELEEADFFMQQSLYTDAKSTLESLLEKHPNHPLVLSKLREVQQARSGGAPNEDLMAATSQGQLESPAPLPVAPDELSGPISTIGAAPTTVKKRGVIDKGVEAEDYETHYDLGIAYKEMGLIDDAITEFRTAMNSPKKEVQCLLMLGLCCLAKGLPAEAVSHFKKGLYVDGVTDRESLTLYFELGQAYEQMHDMREALYYFEKVSKREANFRDVDKKLAQIESGQVNAPQKPNLDDVDMDAALDAFGDGK